MTEPEKQCNKCLAFKPLGEFHNDKSRKDGKMPACKCCINEARRQYSAANPEKQREYDRRSKAVTRHARNQCAVINALDPKKWEILRSKLKAMDSTKTKEKE